MLELHPFRGHVVAAERAHRVVAPPYDALDPAARAALAATDPDSYLGALPPGTPADATQLDAALERCRGHLERLFAAGRYRELPGPTLGVLTFGAGPDRAVAVVGDVPVAAFAALDDPSPVRDVAGAPELVRPHEHVRPVRVRQLARYLDVVGVASSPVALTQRPHPRVTAVTDAVTTRPPALAYRADDGVDVALWCVTDPALCAELTAAVAGAGPAYLADGHHRGAAALEHARTVHARPGDPASRVLCAVLPSDHLAVQAFHRRVDDVLPTSGAELSDAVHALVARLRDAGVAVDAVPDQRLPTGPNRVSMTAGGRWWDLDVAALARRDDLVEGLDVRTVERDLVPLVADEAPATVTPVPAPLGVGALVAPGAVGFALHPPGVEAVLAIAEDGRSVPAKTTYVTPKLRSGLVVTPRPGSRPDAVA